MKPNWWIGRATERQAARWLRRQGFRILGRNIRAGGGEIDILAQEGPVLAIIEVRYRSASILAADLSVTVAKERHLRRCWNAVRRERSGLTHHPARFDLLLTSQSGDFVLLRGVL